jgi:hypothetical protein
LELARRRRLGALIALALIALALIALVGTTLGALALRSRPRPTPAARHAFTIPSADHRIMVEVLNGTARPSLARIATRLLRREGLDVVFFGNTELGRVDSTRVIVRRGDSAAGERVAAALGAGTLVVQTDTLRRVDVTVVLGEDYRGPPEVHP